MLVFSFILAAAGGYLLGSIPFGLVLTRAAGLGDIREIGSGNIGATNVLRTGRKDLALATLLFDAGKAGLALLLAKGLAHWLGGDALGDDAAYQVGLVAGAAAFIGHCYPVSLGFKGGKGVATFFGVLFAGPWPVGLIAGVTWLAVATMFRYSSLAALAAAAIAPVMALLAGFSWEEVVFTLVLAVLVFWRHRANIARLRVGTEPRIGVKKEDGAPPAIVEAAPEPAPPAEPTPEA
ncbi:MAG: glycerol-3-phosphate 1-O-acyltransferase PlsY [Caulobacteraceae bacterium]